MTDIRVTKHASDGRPPYTYDATLLERRGSWIVVEANWPMHEVVAGPISFKPGDVLIEFFSTEERFNAFLIKRQAIGVAGWYCNITHPARIDGRHLHWYDLFLDVIIDETGRIHIEDEDELEAAGLHDSDSELYRSIIDAKDRLLSLIENDEYPFSYVDGQGHGNA